MQEEQGRYQTSSSTAQSIVEGNHELMYQDWTDAQKEWKESTEVYQRNVVNLQTLLSEGKTEEKKLAKEIRGNQLEVKVCKEESKKEDKKFRNDIIMWRQEIDKCHNTLKKKKKEYNSYLIEWQQHMEMAREDLIRVLEMERSEHELHQEANEQREQLNNVQGQCLNLLTRLHGMEDFSGSSRLVREAYYTSMKVWLHNQADSREKIEQETQEFEREMLQQINSIDTYIKARREAKDRFDNDMKEWMAHINSCLEASRENAERKKRERLERQRVLQTQVEEGQRRMEEKHEHMMKCHQALEKYLRERQEITQRIEVKTAYNFIMSEVFWIITSTT